MVQYSMNEGKSMNGNNSTTATAERFPDTKPLEAQWETINWESVERSVNRLQFRIAKATREKKWHMVKRLQYLLTHSCHAKLLAVKKVTTNKGKRTPGIDGEVWTEPATKMRAVIKLTDRRYKAKRSKRVYIEKKSKKAKRPLGIPCIRDRAMQALYALALEPVAETTADNNSFGFRKYRSIRPSKDSIKKFVAGISETIRKEGNIFTQDMLIAHLNQKIRGWTNYHQTVCSKKIFAAIDHQIFEILWHNMKRKHSKKGRRWIVRRYWKTIGNQKWRYAGDSQILLQLAKTPIIRHPRLKLDKNPYLDRGYFVDRQYKMGIKFIRGKYKTVWKRQKGLCYGCGQPIGLEDEKRIIRIASSEGGDKQTGDSMKYMHRYCKYLIPKAAQ